MIRLKRRILKVVFILITILYGCARPNDPSSDSLDSEEKINANEKDILPDKPIGSIRTGNNADDLKEIKLSSYNEPLMTEEFGICYLLNKSGNLDITAVSIQEIYVGSDAENLIKEKNGRKTENTPGTHFEVARIIIVENYKDRYLDVKIRGLDGKRLEYNGNSYTTRVYDLEVKKAENIHELFVYYEVPNGCTKYLLEVGTEAPNVHIETACYTIESNY